MKRQIAALCMIPVAALAQRFADPPVFSADGITLEATAVNDCVEAKAAIGAESLVSAQARDCIGLSADSVDGPIVTAHNLEQAYWEWRISQNYAGLQAWVADKPQTDDFANLRASVATPEAATAHVPLECALRVELKDMPDTAQDDLALCTMRETALVALELEFTVRQACAGDVQGAFALFCGKAAE